ncbi:carboxynorspermidine decarboxylase [Planctomycetales bacterium]|nr:carboxynorspermidine decarboxylase [Planctomycetales bacterium]
MLPIQQEFLARRAAHCVDYAALPVTTPCYVLDVDLLQLNAEFIGQIARAADVKILLALKAFAAFAVFPAIKSAYAGTCASSPDEARLGYEKFGGETHIFSPAFRENEIADYRRWCSHFSFNSLRQFHQFRGALADRSLGLRVNPEQREVATALYDPCRAGSRLGITAANLAGADLTGVAGLHFHNLCECNADALARTVAAVEQKFGDLLPQMEWLNCGGGHHLTRDDYAVELLIATLRRWREKYPATLYLEPGEATALNGGVLVTEVVDVFENDGGVAIVDASAATQMPDVLEMPYRPQILGAGLPDAQRYTYRLGGPSCLAGDEIGAYSFAEELRPGRRLVLTDMAHYSLVKNNTFNGIRLPAIYAYEKGAVRLIKKFGYEDFVGRLS